MGTASGDCAGFAGLKTDLLFLGNVDIFFFLEIPLAGVLRTTCRANLVNGAISKALESRPLLGGLIFQSERECQDVSNIFRAILGQAEAPQSRSRWTNPDIDAWAGFFMGTLKKETPPGVIFMVEDVAQLEINILIEGYYNTGRKLFAIGNPTPEKFEFYLYPN